jgi:transformation/transcription domain-associated protein
VATRHVIATDFRKGFHPYVATLLDEEVLVGTGRACYQALRPLAYSLLAELVHHVRTDLNVQQLSRVIYLFSRNVHDSSLPLSVQATCVRLMLNLVECIYQRRGEPNVRLWRVRGTIREQLGNNQGTIRE